MNTYYSWGVLKGMVRMTTESEVTKAIYDAKEWHRNARQGVSYYKKNVLFTINEDRNFSEDITFTDNVYPVKQFGFYYDGNMLNRILAIELDIYENDEQTPCIKKKDADIDIDVDLMRIYIPKPYRTKRQVVSYADIMDSQICRVISDNPDMVKYYMNEFGIRIG